MKQILVLIILVLTLGLSAQAEFLGIKKASETIAFPVHPPLDSAGIPGSPDSIQVITFADNTPTGPAAYSATGAGYACAGIDTTCKYDAVQMWFTDAIADIDGTGANFQLAIDVIAWYKKLPTHTFATVQVISDSLENVLTAARDSSERAPAAEDIAQLCYDSVKGFATIDDYITAWGNEPNVGYVTVGTWGYNLDNPISGISANWSIPQRDSLLAMAEDLNFHRKAWGSTTVRDLTVKTGFTAATVSDKTGYSLAADQAVNATKIGGTTQTGRDLGASVLLSPGTGTGQIALTSGQVTVGTNNDKTGYTASTVSDKTGYTVSTVSDKTGYSLANIGLDTDTSFTNLQAALVSARARLDSLIWWEGYASTVKSWTHYANNADTVFIIKGVDTIGLSIYYHPSGTPGEAPDTTKFVE